MRSPGHEVLLLETDRRDGLRSSEATERLERYGPNVSPRPTRPGRIFAVAAAATVVVAIDKRLRRQLA